MRNLDRYAILAAEKAKAELERVAACDENVQKLYQKICPIIEDVIAGRLTPMTEALNGYGYYFSPEGPWGIWEKYPDLVDTVCDLLNTLDYSSDPSFARYCERLGIDPETFEPKAAIEKDPKKIKAKRK